MYPVGWGRADLISGSGEVWEVKRDRIWHIYAGEKQVKKYVANTWKNNRTKSLRIGGEIESGSFTYTSGLATYKVTYRYAGNGVIAYDYALTEINVKPILDACIVVGVAAVSGMISGMVDSSTREDEIYLRE